MTTKVGIIGVGHVGAAVAEAMVMRRVASEIVLIDSKDQKAKAEQLDLTDQQALLNTHTKITALPYSEKWDFSDIDVLVISAGDISILHGDNPDRFAELKNSVSIIKEIAPRIKHSGFKGIILSITNPCDVVLTYLQQLTGFDRSRCIGTGTTLDTTRMKRAVSVTFDCNMADVTGYQLGEHGESQFTAWSTVYVAGQSVIQLAKDKNIPLEELKNIARKGAWDILHGKGFTSYGIGLTAAIMTEAILNDQKKAFPCSSYNETFGVYIGQMTRIGKDGVLKTIALDLPKEEQERFEASAKRIKETYDTIA